MFGVKRLHTDKKRFDNSNKNPATFSGFIEVSSNYREEGRKNNRRRKEGQPRFDNLSGFV